MNAPSPSLDPRAAKSRASLMAAMTELIDETLEPPSVSEVVARAGSSRPTFYQHFGDVPTLIHEAAMFRLADAFERLTSTTHSDDCEWVDFARDNFTALFEHLVEHRDFYLAVVNGPSGVAALDRLIDFLGERMHTISPLRFTIRDQVGDAEAPRFAQFLAAGLISVAIEDLKKRKPVSAMVHTTTMYLAAATGHRTLVGEDSPHAP